VMLGGVVVVNENGEISGFMLWFSIFICTFSSNCMLCCHVFVRLGFSHWLHCVFFCCHHLYEFYCIRAILADELFDF